jgi:hypothetical protein
MIQGDDRYLDSTEQKLYIEIGSLDFDGQPNAWAAKAGGHHE